MGKRPRSNSQKAQLETNRRIKYSKTRRFNDPLRCFVERKYPKIFNEYVKFYEHLNRLNPTRKNLTKSNQFKDWLIENSSLISLQPELEIELIPSKLAEIIVKLCKIELSLQAMNQGEAVMNEGEVTNEGEAVTNQGEAIMNEVVMNEGDALNLQGIEPTLESLVDELLEDDTWQELLNQDLSGIYTHIETNGGF